MSKLWLNTSLVYLFIVALLGTLLRLMSFESFGIKYANLLHAHSHIAFLGWLYNILFVLLIYAFISPDKKEGKSYVIIFWLIQLANLGMLISFPIQGYGLYSISFSTFHILISYWFVYQFLKDANSNSDNFSKHYLSFKFIKAALFFMILSSVGPFSVGPIMATNGSGSDLYYNAIYFYLHFQYNGWFSFATIGLFIWMLERNNIEFSKSKGKLFYQLMLISVIPAYLLSVLWAKPPAAIYIVAGISAVLQVFALIILLSFIAGIKVKWKNNFNSWSYFLMFFSLSGFSAKIILQLISSFPYFADLAFQIRGFTIGYLHLVFIGFVSFFLFAFLIKQEEFSLNRNSKLGLFLFISGFVISEVIIFAQAIFVWLVKEPLPHYALLLLNVSLLMLIGSILLVGNSFFLSKKPVRRINIAIFLRQTYVRK